MEESHEPHAHHDHGKHLKLYLGIGGALFACTAITVWLSYVDFGSSRANFIVAMIVATIKAGLVGAIFMHLLSERWTIYRVLLLTGFFVLGLFLLTLLAFHNPISL
ncbi:MAG: cytochrome c oxidase subunit [Chthoniobacter sp.]|nr:cytochrome c oxidase subunit [Chthoniobacter sp.]